MGGKKSKALAKELIDDLLNDDVTAKSDHVPEPQNLNSPEDVEISQTSPVELGREASSSESKDTSRTRLASQAANLPAVPNESSRSELKGKSSDDEKIRATVGRPATFRSSGGNSATEAALAQSESLRIAQQRIFELEQEIDRLRVKNEELVAAAETLRRVGDESMAESHKLRSAVEELKGEAAQEKSLLIEAKEQIRKELDLLKTKNEELERRVSNNIQKIRVRERELENRLELVKMEGAALVRSKDELLLDLKRQVDQLNVELTNYRNKNQELIRSSNEKQEILRRTVKTLRLALSMLEGEDSVVDMQKKAK